ncbi:MAG TPA: hypothetical protein VMM77_10000 [Gemmatimonadaceae bacterium]|nr:hypothetical protein [Gemmatimonadaceae bacterium]
MREVLAFAAVAMLAAPIIDAQEVRIRRAGPGRAGSLARETLAAPHDVLAADTGRVLLPRGTTSPRSVLVLGGDAAVGAHVQGDVVVVGGDLYMHPGAVIDGRAIALGGCVYSSSLATVAGGTECLRDVSFDVRRTPTGFEISYVPPRSQPVPVLAVPFPGGVRLPTYTRVDGLGLPWGPRVTLADGAIEIDPTITYRSATGEIDPLITVHVGAGSVWFANANIGRETRTNDGWIRQDQLNAVIALFTGRDVRNYYRSRNAALRAGRMWERGGTLWSAWLGGQLARDASTHARAPWSAFDRRDTVEGMARPNPAIARGDVRSALAGAGVEWLRDGVDIRATVETEMVLDAPGDSRFVQSTGHSTVTFPTFGSQTFALDVHAVLTAGDRAVPQRFAYLGGSGTLTTRDLLSMGGDQLVFVESSYAFPIERYRVPFLGPPTISLRHMMGSAGVDSLPDLVQNLGLRLALTPFRVDFMHDPASGDSEISFGVTFGR